MREGSSTPHGERTFVAKLQGKQLSARTVYQYLFLTEIHVTASCNPPVLDHLMLARWQLHRDPVRLGLVDNLVLGDLHGVALGVGDLLAVVHNDGDGLLLGYPPVFKAKNHFCEINVLEFNRS